MNRPATRFGASAALALALAGTAVVAQTTAQSTASPTPGQQPVFRSGVNLVILDAYPRRSGRIVEGLAPSDFQVFEDGKPQKIETFEFIRVEPSATTELTDPNNQREMLLRAADPHNRVFVAYLDSSFVTVTGAHDIRQPLTDFFDRALAPNDLFGVLTDITPVGSLVLQRRTGSIESQLSENWPWGERERIATNPSDSEERALQDCFDDQIPANLAELVPRLREQRAIQHVTDLARRLGSMREARSIVVLVSDGWIIYKPNNQLEQDVSARLLQTSYGLTPKPPITSVNGKLGVGNLPPGYYDEARCSAKALELARLDDEMPFRDLLKVANDNNVSIYPINPDGLRAWDEPPASTNTKLSAADNQQRVIVRSDMAKTLAENTGGVAVSESNDLRAGMKQLIDDVSAYYLIGYYSTNPKFDGKLRQIKVKVNQPQVEVNARHSYVAPTEAEMAAKSKSAASASAAPALPGLDNAMNVLGRLDSETAVFSQARVEDDDLAVSVELASRLVASGEWSKGGTVRIAVTGIAAPITASIAPGARGVVAHVPVGLAAGPFAVTVTVTGADTLTDRLTIARTPDSAAFGQPLVSRGGAAAASPLRPAADFQFARIERVHVEVPEHAVLTSRSARVVDRHGQPMPFEVAVTERDVNNVPTLIADLTLAPFAAADYAIDISGTVAGAAPEHVIIPLRVTR